MSLRRAPGPALRPFVETLWISEAGGEARAARERVLPTGRMHLVLRLGGAPLCVYDREDDPAGRVVGAAVVGGARAGFYLRDLSAPGPAVGALLRPGAGPAVLGVPADALAGRHTPLEALWGAEAERGRERVAAARGPRARLAAFEAWLAGRIAPRPLHPAVAHAVERLAAGAPVGRVVAEAGLSHRRFVELFRRAVGLRPASWARVLRFRRALLHAHAAGDRDPWAAVALAAGYADQSHLHRDFRAFAGVTPGAYRALAPREAHHVPLVPAVRRGSRTSKTSAREPGSLGAPESQREETTP